MNRKKHLIFLSVVFYSTMLVFTCISKYIAIAGLPLVETAYFDGVADIPEEILYEDPILGTYVQTVYVEQSILGEQYVVEYLSVKIQEKTSEKITIELEDGCYEIILKADRKLMSGDKVRIK